MKRWFVAVVVLFAVAGHVQSAVQYRLQYPAAGDRAVKVEISLKTPVAGPVALVVPRNYPGGYDLVLYDSYVENVHAYSENGEELKVERAKFGPRWNLGAKGKKVARVTYAVDLARMEKEVLSAVETSKVRPGYVGVLGYSVFGYVEGLENTPVELQVEGPKDWPVFTTLKPEVPAPVHEVSATAENYYALADSQVLMGPDLQLRRFDGPIALVMAVYAESEEDIAEESELAHTALNDVQRYFGDTPFPAYTVSLELLKPVPGHDYGFSQEHLTSGSFSLSIERAMTGTTTAQQKRATLLNYAHHMAHSWIPKRAYGEGYMPFLWEMPPVIETIWFNEGFGRYASIAAVADAMPQPEGAELRRKQLEWLQSVVDQAPEFIRRMPLLRLSEEASFMYSEDFRIGMNTFARGSLMAAEMDDAIRTQTKGQKSLRDGLNALIAQTQREKRPLTIEEMPSVIQKATGVDVRGILEKWMQAGSGHGR